jgi:hypothetical protein
MGTAMTARALPIVVVLLLSLAAPAGASER